MKALRFAVVVALVASGVAVSAQRSNLRLGTILPANSIWDRSLKDMAAAWQEASGSRCGGRPATRRPSSAGCE